MRQTLTQPAYPAKRPTRDAAGRSARVPAVLVLGIVIGRITVLGNGASEVYLRDNQPIAKAPAARSRPRIRPALVPVAPVGGARGR